MTTNLFDDVWQIDAYGRTTRGAIDEFARTNWDKPRKAKRIQPDGTFELVDGIHKYRARHVPGSATAPPLFVVAQLPIA